MLIYITYQDFKYRAIPWIVFPLLVIVIVILNYLGNKEELSFIFLMINTMFVITQMLLITIYLSLKEKRVVKVWERYIGWGDILFFAILCFFFSPGNFIAFYIISLLFTIVSVLGIKAVNTNFTEVPLAGIQSGLLAILLILNWHGQYVNIMSDEWIMNLLDGRS